MLNRRGFMGALLGAVCWLPGLRWAKPRVVRVGEGKPYAKTLVVFADGTACVVWDKKRLAYMTGNIDYLAGFPQSMHEANEALFRLPSQQRPYGIGHWLKQEFV